MPWDSFKSDLTYINLTTPDSQSATKLFGHLTGFYVLLVRLAARSQTITVLPGTFIVSEMFSWPFFLLRRSRESSFDFMDFVLAYSMTGGTLDTQVCAFLNRVHSVQLTSPVKYQTHLCKDLSKPEHNLEPQQPVCMWLRDLRVGLITDWKYSVCRLKEINKKTLLSF